MDTADFRRELDRRLTIIEDTGYEDPARAELPARDWILLLIGCVVVIGVALAWGLRTVRGSVLDADVIDDG